MDQNSVRFLLQEELQYLENILKNTQKFLGDYQETEELAIQEIGKFLGDREDLIKNIIKLEDDKNFKKFTSQEKQLKKEISRVARKLVEIDARILDILSKKKKKIVKDINKVADIRNEGSYKKQGTSKLVDIEG